METPSELGGTNSDSGNVPDYALLLQHCVSSRSAIGRMILITSKPSCSFKVRLDLLLQGKHPRFFFWLGTRPLIFLLHEFSTSMPRSGWIWVTLGADFASSSFLSFLSSEYLSLLLSFSVSFSFSFFLRCFSSNSFFTRSTSASISTFLFAAAAAASMIGLQNDLSFKWPGHMKKKSLKVSDDHYISLSGPPTLLSGVVMTLVLGL